jgi:uncharacterized membrane protein
MDTRRAESFSDGVFAVAITVLVFNLLAIGHGPLTYRLLLDSWPQYAAYVVSFLTIGIMWLNHHTMLSQVSRVDRITLVINTFLLMGVVAVPFPTALVADHLTADAPAGGRVAAVVYGLVMIAISISYSTMWLYLSAHREALGAKVMRAPRQATLRFSTGLIGYVVATLVAAFWSSGVSLAIYGLIAVYYLFEHLPNPVSSGESDDPFSEPKSPFGQSN